MLNKAKKSPKAKGKGKKPEPNPKPHKVEMVTKSPEDVELWEKVLDDFNIIKVEEDGDLKIEEVKEYIEKYFQEKMDISEANKVVHNIFQEVDAKHDKIVTVRDMYEYIRKGRKESGLDKKEKEEAAEGSEEEEADEKEEEADEKEEESEKESEGKGEDSEHWRKENEKEEEKDEEDEEEKEEKEEEEEEEGEGEGNDEESEEEGEEK